MVLISANALRKTDLQNTTDADADADAATVPFSALFRCCFPIFIYRRRARSKDDREKSGNTTMSTE